jgi:hypothetical protein
MLVGGVGNGVYVNTLLRPTSSISYHSDLWEIAGVSTDEEVIDTVVVDTMRASALGFRPVPVGGVSFPRIGVELPSVCKYGMYHQQRRVQHAVLPMASNGTPQLSRSWE